VLSSSLLRVEPGTDRPHPQPLSAPFNNPPELGGHDLEGTRVSVAEPNRFLMINRAPGKLPLEVGVHVVAVDA